MNCQLELPERYPNDLQRWMPSTYQPYPMNFSQAPSAQHQVSVSYQDQPFLQGLSPNTGPYMYPDCRKIVISGATPIGFTQNLSKIQSKHQYQPSSGLCKKSAIMYPTTHSIPGPYLRSYINIPRGRTYPY